MEHTYKSPNPSIGQRSQRAITEQQKSKKEGTRLWAKKVKSTVRKVLGARSGLHESFNETMNLVHDNAKAHGWHDEPREDGTIIALISCWTFGGTRRFTSWKSPERSHSGIFFSRRIAGWCCYSLHGLCGFEKMHLGEAIVKKMLFNINRPFKHGNKAFWHNGGSWFMTDKPNFLVLRWRCWWCGTLRTGCQK
jgi:hypothetical protein